MKTDPRGSLLLKVVTLFLSALLAGGVFLCALGMIFLASGHAYGGPGSYFSSDACHTTAYSEAEHIYYTYLSAAEEPAEWGEQWTAEWSESSNAGFVISGGDDGETPLLSVNMPEDPAFINDYWFQNDDGTAVVTIALPAELTVEDDFYAAWSLYQRLLPQKNTLFFCAVLGVVLTAAAVIFLCCAAGHRRGREDVLPNYLDRMPFDLWLVLAVFGGMGCIAPLTDWYAWQEPILWGALWTVCLLGLFLLLLATLLTFATRVKLGNWWRNTIVYKTLRLLWRMVRGLWHMLAETAHALPLVWKTALLFCGFALLQGLLAIESAYSGDGFLLLLALDICALFFLCRVTLSLKKLREGGARLSAGDAEFRVDTAKMPRALREHGEDLNALGGGIAIAVERQLKSERMKTELITNVSHDIKTPLTSILNYVDLLQKDPTPEQRTEYLAVLDRQAKRLKKLTEDLVEASKAATGSLQVALERTDLGELLRQAAGEYEERLEKNDLTPVLTLPETPLPILADGRLLWRVIDNLLSNACKYAQPGTRVYLDARQVADRAVLSVRNISRQQLNIDPEELMERFVRGDSARNTEGSGLGLNIARSLAELQRGTLELTIDGDLFKATAAFPLAD